MNRNEKLLLLAIPSTISLFAGYRNYKHEKLNSLLLKKFGYPYEFMDDADEETQIKMLTFVDKIDSQLFGIIRYKD